ncbi:MAG: tetratricopeptide repeat protein [Spirochaetales bacterium]|nr:MAG: tetratricopeptide repeat protein [Spirochaetales bacterium]
MRTKTAILMLLGVALCGAAALAQTKAKEKAEDDGFKKATAYFYERKFEMAEILLQEELKKNPENRLAYSYLGDIFFYKKRMDGAMELYKKALELDPKGAEEYFRLGQIHYYKKEAFRPCRTSSGRTRSIPRSNSRITTSALPTSCWSATNSAPYRAGRNTSQLRPRTRSTKRYDAPSNSSKTRTSCCRRWEARYP